MKSIDRRGHGASVVFQRFGLAPFRSILSSSVFTAAAIKSGCAPKRDRPLIPEVVAWLMMHVGLTTTSMTQGLHSAWGLLQTTWPGLASTPVTEEAFCQARRQLTLGFWRYLWTHLSQRFEAHFSRVLLWKGRYRLLAVDGTDVNLPMSAKLAEFFGFPKNQHGTARVPQARLVSLCSVLTGFCFEFKLLTRRFTEHEALRHFVRRLRRNDLLLMDCGFFSLRRDLADSPASRPLSHATVRATGRLRPASTTRRT